MSRRGGQAGGTRRHPPRRADGDLIETTVREIILRYAHPGHEPGYFRVCRQEDRQGTFNKAVFDTEDAVAVAARQCRIATARDFWYYPCHLVAGHWHLTTHYGQQVQRAIAAGRDRT